MAENRTPASNGAIVYIPFPNSHAGTTYEIGKVNDGVGYVDDSTEIIVNYHDSHLPDGAFDITFEDDALAVIAEKAKELKTNARGLKQIIEKMLLKYQFEAMDLADRGLTTIIINKDTVLGGKAVLIFDKENGKKSKQS